MGSRLVSRLLGALAAGSAIASVAAVGCEPQDIYLFDEASAGLEGGDAGVDEPAPAPSEPEPAAPPAREQPSCESEECNRCMDRGGCSTATATLFCHPITGDCELPCDPGAERACPATDQCDPVLELCVQCVSDADCNYGPRQMCNVSRGQCIECALDQDCPSERPLCDPYSRCVECVEDGDCAATGGVCQPGPQRCVQCRDDRDCRAIDDDTFCLIGQQRCVECVTDSDCTDDPHKPFCSSENECEDERE